MASAGNAAGILLERGAKNVIVTLGAKGALIVSGKQVTHVNVYQVDVVDTTAAGDAFIGGFAAKLLESEGLPSGRQVSSRRHGEAPAFQNAVRYGCACGALAATKFGAQPSLSTREEAEKFIS
jgi:ribokinase